MDEHLFHREPWLSLAVLLALGALIYGRTRTAMRVARTTREELERGAKQWKIARGPSLVMTSFALVLLGVLWLGTEGQYFFFGDVIALFAILLFPSLAEAYLRTNPMGIWRDNPSAQGRMFFTSLFSGAQVGAFSLYYGKRIVLGELGDTPWTVPGVLTLTLFVPSFLYLAWALLGSEALFQGKRGTLLSLLFLPYLLLWGRLLVRVTKHEACWSLQANLHDALALGSLFAFVAVQIESCRRAEQLGPKLDAREEEPHSSQPQVEV